jgi:uncharacterized protein (UPF0548 family)
MKTSVFHAAVMACAILSSSLFPSEPSLAQGCPTPSFDPPNWFDLGAAAHLPNSVAVGDFDGDAKLDLAVANWGRNPADTPDFRGSVSVLLGNGDGTFQAAANYSAGSWPMSIAVGDFNRDGKPDLAAANTEPATPSGYGEARGSVSVLLGNGDGTFQPAVNYSVGTNPVSVAVSDVNGDDKPDLIVAASGSNPNFFDSSVSVLLGNGDGTFQPAVNYSTGPHTTSLAVGDFNGDGKPDLAVANYGSHARNYTDASVSVLLGNGDGTFQRAVNYSGGSLPLSVAVGDFNGDGKPDLAVGNYGWLKSDYGISVLLGNGDGTFQAAVGFPFDPTGATIYEPDSIAVGDFNGDGKLDLAVADGSHSNPAPGVLVLLGNGDGTFQTAVNFDAGPGSTSVALGDFNGDGAPDLAVANGPSASVVVLLNTCVSASPSLAVSLSNATLTVSWPFPSTGFVLESTPSLSPPNWQPAVETPLTNNALLEVMVPVNPGSRYFRLHKP